MVMDWSPVRATADGKIRSAPHLALPRRLDNWGKKGVCFYTVLAICSYKERFYFNQPHTHSVPGPSLSGSLSPGPELHCEARWRSGTFPGQSTTCCPWTTLNHRYADTRQGLRWTQYEKRWLRNMTGVCVCVCTWSWDWGHSVWHRWTEHPHQQQIHSSSIYSQSEEELEEIGAVMRMLPWMIASFVVVNNVNSLFLNFKKSLRQLFICCVCPCCWPWTVILPRVLALPAELVAKHMYWPESSAVMLSKMSVQEPSGSSMMMWWGSASTGRPSTWSNTTHLASGGDNTTSEHCGAVDDLPLYQMMEGLGTPVALQASFTVWPNSAVQFARISSKSGGPGGINYEKLSQVYHKKKKRNKRGDKCVALTPRRHAVTLLQLSEVSQPRVLHDNRPSLQSVLPHRVLALVPDLEGSVVALHRLVHVNVVQLWQDGESKKHRSGKKKQCWKRKGVMVNIYLHHVLEDVWLGLSVAVSLGFADDAVVLKQKNVTMVTSGGCPYPRSPFPHLERSLILERQNKWTHKTRTSVLRGLVTQKLSIQEWNRTCLIGSPNTSSVAG